MPAAAAHDRRVVFASAAVGCITLALITPAPPPAAPTLMLPQQYGFIVNLTNETETTTSDSTIGINVVLLLTLGLPRGVIDQVVSFMKTGGRTHLRDRRITQPAKLRS